MTEQQIKDSKVKRNYLGKGGKMDSFVKELENLINKHSIENESNTL